LVRKRLGEILRMLAKAKEVVIHEGDLRKDHVHMLMSIPPKYSTSMIIGWMKGKSAILLHREFGRQKGIYGKHFWARGYWVSTVGVDERVVREYIQKQEYIETAKEGKQVEMSW